MKAINKVFKYCKHCKRPLSGQQRKFCSYECAWIYHAARARESNGFEILENMKEQAILKTILDNSSEAAYNEAKRLL